MPKLVHRSALAVIVCAALLAVIILCLSAFAAPRRIVLHVEQADFAWGKSDLTQHVVSRLSRSSEIRTVVSSDLAETSPAFPEAVYDIDSLLEWGREIGGHYLFVIVVTSERLETAKTFSLPLIVHRWETVAVIEGEVRMLDLNRGRLLWAEPFHEQLRARSVLQGDADQTKADADLHVPAEEKQLLFSELEERLTDRLTTKVRRLARSR
jgi:hypothetical protein